VAEGYVRAAVLGRKLTGINIVCLSGGVFHNALLYRLLNSALAAEGFETYSQSIVSPGDGGISYGQAVVAGAKLKTVVENMQQT